MTNDISCKECQLAESAKYHEGFWHHWKYHAWTSYPYTWSILIPRFFVFLRCFLFRDYFGKLEYQSPKIIISDIKLSWELANYGVTI